jgi:hypothetical protein
MLSPSLDDDAVDFALGARRPAAAETLSNRDVEKRPFWPDGRVG